MKFANPYDNPKVQLQNSHHLFPWSRGANMTRKSRMEVES